MHEDVRRSPKVRAVADFLVRVLAEGEAARKTPKACAPPAAHVFWLLCQRR